LSYIGPLESSMNLTQSNPANASEKGGGDGRTINLHPLSIISISDHFTRVSMGASVQSDKSRILGLLFGVQVGREVSIFDSCEVVYSSGTDGAAQLDQRSVENKIELFTAVYPTYELLGWYSVGTEVLDDDLKIQRAMTSFNESPLFLLMDPSPLKKEDKKDLPVTIYESELHVVQDRPTLIFVQIDFHLRTAQAEQISVEEVSRANPTDGASSVEPHLRGVSTSLTTLGSRLEKLSRYLELIKEGKIEIDHRMLRQIYNLCQSLPAANSEEFRSNFNSEYSDTLMVSYLAGITKSTHALNDIADKYLVTYGERHRRADF